MSASVHSSWPAAPGATSSRAWPWRRRCASGAGACTGWARPGAAWKASWCRRMGLCRLDLIDFSGVRGKGPGHAGAACRCACSRRSGRALQVVRRVKPDVVVGLGGYITFPAGMMGVLLGKPLVLHEQNSVAGMANKVLAGVADRVFTAFPDVLKKAQWVGNPLRTAFTLQQAPPPAALCRPQRTAAGAGRGRQPGCQGAQRGGAPGAGPAAAGTAPTGAAPERRHADRRAAGQLRRRPVCGRTDPFIDNTAQAFAGRPGDLPRRRQHRDRNRRCGCGRAVRAVPVCGGRPPDHQCAFLVDQGGGWLIQQSDLSPERLARMLQETAREELLGAPRRRGICARPMPPAQWWLPVRNWRNETRNPAHPLCGHRRLRHERHRRDAAEPGLCDLRLGPGRQCHAAAAGAWASRPMWATRRPRGRCRCGRDLHRGAGRQPRGAGRPREAHSRWCRAR
jgi:UDP-N-acetylglucosamine--N-acetylmuramyl-(pentapeptide) pyrophosphoryl-undecaprenol N-acetylglucosamine transferase